MALIMMWTLAFAGPGEILEGMLFAIAEPERHELREELVELMQSNPPGLSAYLQGCSVMHSSDVIECLQFSFFIQYRKNEIVSNDTYDYRTKDSFGVYDGLLNKKTIEDLIVFMKKSINSDISRKDDPCMVHLIHFFKENVVSKGLLYE